MNTPPNPYFARRIAARSSSGHHAALARCVERLRSAMPTIGLRNPKIGRPEQTWDYCDRGDWVIGFYSGQLWLAYQLTGENIFRNAAQARRPEFEYILRNRRVRDHDLGFQFSLHSVADWMSTGCQQAHRMALSAAEALIARFREDGSYIQAWTPWGGDPARARYVNGRMIADTMQNLALLHWAHRETGITDFLEVAQAHSATSRLRLIRDDDTSFHTFVFDPATGEPIRGETHQGYSHNSCWSRGHGWLLHGFAQSFTVTRDIEDLATARRLATKLEELLGRDNVPVWDFSAPDDGHRVKDSSAGAVLAAGLYILATATEGDEAERWRALADRMVDGLIEECDLTQNPDALGLLGQGAAHVRAGQTDAMLPYGDYYFMEALMRSAGHERFFW